MEDFETIEHPLLSYRSPLMELQIQPLPPWLEMLEDNEQENISTQSLPANFNMDRVSSPDEFIIQQRGRRQNSFLSPSTSGNSIRSPQPFQNSPLKSSTPVSLVKCHRKRNILNEDELTIESTLKKMKLNHEDSISQTSTLELRLKPFSREQLLHIIKSIVRSKPDLAEKIRNELPMADLSSLRDELTGIEREIIRARTSPVRWIRTGGRRFTTLLSQFESTIVRQSHLLYESQHWDALVDYILMASPFVAEHESNIRKKCYRILTWYSDAALGFAGHLLGKNRLQLLEKSLSRMSKDCDVLLVSLRINQLLRS